MDVAQHSGPVRFRIERNTVTFPFRPRSQGMVAKFSDSKLEQTYETQK